MVNNSHFIFIPFFLSAIFTRTPRNCLYEEYLADSDVKKERKKQTNKEKKKIYFGLRSPGRWPGWFRNPNGSGSTRPDTNSARESTRPRVNSAGSTRPLIFPITGGVFYKYMMF